MTGLAFLVPIALFMGLVGLAAFLWTVRSRQYEDLDGAAWRILSDDEDKPAGATPSETTRRRPRR